MSNRLYLGVSLEKREIFRSETTPTNQSHGEKYVYVIGPFRTKRGAEFMRDHGYNNPHCRCVADAEKLASNAAVRKWGNYFANVAPKSYQST
jgi:hypothetical protein